MKRKFDRELSPLAYLALDRNYTAHGFYQLFGYGETQTSSAIDSTRVSIFLVKWFKDHFVVIRGNSCTVILDFEYDVRACHWFIDNVAFQVNICQTTTAAEG